MRSSGRCVLGNALFLSLFVLALLVGLFVRPASALPPSFLCFEGQWSERGGAGNQDFSFHLRIEDRTNELSGVFTWRQVHTVRSSHNDGRIGQEFLSGRRAGSRFELRGVRVSDPNVLGLDRYRLIVEGQVLRGSSATFEDDWSGQIAGRRIPCVDRAQPPR